MCMDTLRQATDSSESKGVTLGFLQIGPSCTSVCLDFVNDLVENNQIISTKMVMNKMFHCVGFVFDLNCITAFLAVVLRALESKERLKVPRN